jgi:hypothetical protein
MELFPHSQINPYTLRTYVGGVQNVLDTTTYEKRFCFEANGKLKHMFEKTMSNFKTGNFKSDLHKAEFRRLFLYAVYKMLFFIIDNLKDSIASNDAASLKFQKQWNLVVYGQGAPATLSRPEVADFELFLVPTLSDLSVSVDKPGKYVRMKIHKHGLEFNMFPNPASRELDVECRKFKGEDSIVHTEPYIKTMREFVDEITQKIGVHQIFQTPEQVALLNEEEKKLYTYANPKSK